jgi:transposase
MPKLALEHPKRVFHLGADAGLGLFQLVDQLSQQGALVQRLALAMAHGHVPGGLDVPGFIAFVHTLIARVGKNIAFIAMHQRVRLGDVMDVGGSACEVTTADVTDRKGALQALGRCKGSLGQVQSLLCDSGYVGQPFERGVKEVVGQHVTVQIAKRSELHTFKVMPKRWAVEGSFAWLDKNRRLWENCERLVNTSLQFIHLAFLALLLKRF